MCFPTLLAVPMAIHGIDPHPQLVVVGLVDPTVVPTWGHPCDLMESGAPLVGPVGSRSSVFTLVLILYPYL